MREFESNNSRKVRTAESLGHESARYETGGVDPGSDLHPHSTSPAGDPLLGIGIGTGSVGVCPQGLGKHDGP